MQPAREASRWVYEGVWAALSGLFLVPREPPVLPAGSGASVRAFRPCDGWLRYRKIVFWFVCLVIDIALIAAWIALCVEHPGVALWLAAPWLVLIVAPDVVAYVAIHLRYDTTWYVLSDRSMRIRRGVWIIHETTITFDNVQNVGVTQGPIQRLLGFSDLVVQTAGGGGAAGPHGASAGGGSHVGLIEGVEDPAAMRELIMERVRRSRSAGLGDERLAISSAAGASGWTSEHVNALRRIAEHAASLRTAGSRLG